MLSLMIVDDEPYIVEGLAKMIREAGTAFTRIEEAADAIEAIGKMAAFAPDVVITDLNMPEKNGFELMEASKRGGYCERFIVLTGYDEFEYARRALRAGVIDYLLKPINRDEMLRLLEAIAGELLGGLGEGGEAANGTHIDRLKKYIDDHYSEPLSLDDLADFCGLHPNYVSGLFRKACGQSFIKYLNALRIDKARALLRSEPHTPVNLIGQRVGFESPQHFAKMFKKRVGVSPGSYREGAARETGRAN